MVASCLARIQEVEPRVHAWSWIDPERATRLAAGLDAGERRSELHGIPVGVKDIIDVAGIPAEFGAAHFRGRVPSTSAACVLAVEQAGGLLLGKTVTAEMAYFTPGPTTNPWNADHTPGGSSMGSAAAVAAGMTPLAIGTQTNGSIIRPASFCGVVGYKPTAGTVDRAGVAEFSRSFDTVGSFATSVSAAAVLVAVMARRPLGDFAPPAVERPRLAGVRTAAFGECQPAMSACFEDSVAALAEAGAEVVAAELPPDLEDVRELHDRIQLHEAAEAIGGVVLGHPEGFSERLRAAIAKGKEIGPEEYRADLAERERLIVLLDRWASDFDAIVTPPALGEAPGTESTGDPRFCTLWSLLGAPALCLPAAFGPAGLPLGIQFSARPGEDRRLLGAAAWAEVALRR